MGRTKLALTVLVILCTAVATWVLVDSGVSQAYEADKNPSTKSLGYAGSVSCRECHERFYQLWSTSFHGLAMQPYTAQFAKAKLISQKKDITIGKSSYEADLSGDKGWVTEQGKWPWNRKKYPIEHVLGGKNVYYFLTPMERGRLPEGGEGLMCGLEKRIRLRSGSYRVYLGLPEEEFETEVAISLPDSSWNVLECRPIYWRSGKSPGIFWRGGTPEAVIHSMGTYNFF